MAETKKSRRLLLSPLVVLAVFGGLLWQRQFIYDQVKLYNYEPSAKISQLATDTAMTEDSRKVFYVNHPELIDKQKFSSFCTIHSEQTAVLGCYKGPQNGIYLLSVDNAELNGIIEVTAAHEMLHAEYDRLSSGRRTEVNALLQDYYRTKLTDESTKKTIDGYRKTAPDDLVNEIHSIIGTQIGDLPAELESYYARYFTDRSKVVSLYQKYEAAFSTRQALIEDFDIQLEDQKQRLDQLEKSVDQQSDALQAQRARLDQLQAGDARTYNAEVDQYNAAVNRYNSDIRSLRALVESYNQLVQRRNEISFEEQKLVDAISSPSLEQQ